VTGAPETTICKGQCATICNDCGGCSALPAKDSQCGCLSPVPGSTYGQWKCTSDPEKMTCSGGCDCDSCGGCNAYFPNYPAPAGSGSNAICCKKTSGASTFYYWTTPCWCNAFSTDHSIDLSISQANNCCSDC
jgi:hypothetical protein